MNEMVLVARRPRGLTVASTYYKSHLWYLEGIVRAL